MLYKKIYAALAAFRWLMLIFYIGLGLALLGYSLYFCLKVAGFLSHLFSFDSVDAILNLLGLIDSTLVASLVVMVMLSGFNIFIADGKPHEKSVAGDISFGQLKLKFAITLVLIGAINILESAMETGQLNLTNILLQCAVEITLIIATLAFAYTESLHKR